MFAKLFVYKSIVIRSFSSLGKHSVLHHFERSVSPVKNNCFKMKIDSPEFQKILTKDLQVLLDTFRKYNYEIRIAGGAVRDLLLGKTASDVDFATNATPNEMKDMFAIESIRTINAKGEKHGTITARINQSNFEVTTLRIDVVTDGRHAQVEFTKDWELDAGRRDFTVNSMYLGPDGTLYDYCGGYEHLKQRKIIFVGDAEKRITEDYLRILRYFRFYGKICEIENDHDEETLRVLSRNVEGLGRISGERIWVELKKILVGNYSASLTATLVKCGAAEYIGLPEHCDVSSLKILLERIKGLDVSPVTVVSALFNNSDEFLKFNSRCKLSNQEKNLGLFVIENRLCDESLKYFKTLLLTPRQPPVTRQQVTELFKYRGDIVKLNEFQNWETPSMPVNGNDLLELGVPAGRALGDVMNRLKLHWIDGDFKSDKQQLLRLVPAVSQQINIKLNSNNC